MITREVIEKANAIITEMDQLQEQINEIPRYIVNRREYEKSNHKYMYIPRFFRRFRDDKQNVLQAFKGHGEKDYVLELTEEDLQALVDIRKRKLAELDAELRKLEVKECAEDV